MRRQTQPLSFADLELWSQGVALNATLQTLADFLDAHEELVTLVHADLVRGLKRPGTGRDGLGAARVLRAFVLQRVKDWDLRELRERIADGYTLRWSCPGSVDGELLAVSTIDSPASRPDNGCGGA